MRVVLDTNVLISGIFFGGAPGRIIQAWRNHGLELVVSEEILREYLAVCERVADRYPATDIRTILLLVAENSTIVHPRPLPEPVSRDPADDKFIACAVSGNAGIIVSGDKDLLDVSPTVLRHRDIVVVNPRGFLDNYLA